MGLKKYEIITVGSDKRVRALRSWQVGDRYVNIGDVGGIVYDEKTLSQDGACWLFRGNFGFPGARIGGDSIVDVGEAPLSAAGAPNVDILGSSVVVGSKLTFISYQTAADALVLGASDFEQGGLVYSGGANWETWKVPRASNIRLKAPIFRGGAATTLKIEVPGYAVQVFVMDRDGNGITAKAPVITGEGVTLEVPAGQYFTIMLAKNPGAAIVPADATSAQIRFTGMYETKLVMVDSRLEVNPATSTAITMISPGGTYTMSPGAKYPDSVMQNSKVSILTHVTSNRGVRFMSSFSNVNATIDATSADAQAVGIYCNVNNLVFSGTFTGALDQVISRMIQAYDCDNMVVTTANIPGFTAIRTAGVPIKFYRCNLNNARIYHHAQIANTYRDINFDLATADLGKTFSTDRTLGSSEVNGMYRAIFNGAPGPLIESYESVKNMVVTQNQKMYDTTIYADAYFNGAFDIQGTNVFGHKVRSHSLAQVLNVQPRVVQGNFNATSVGATIGAIVTTPLFVSTPIPFRVNGAKGLTVNNLPAGFVALLFLVDQNNVITRFGSGTEALPAAALTDMKAFIRFSKSDNSPITPADLAGVTITTYNGCKIVNTGETAVPMKGNIRVEDNATLTNCSIIGSGYFGGNSIAQGLTVEGTVYMKDNAVFAPTVSGAPKASILYMTDNATYTGVFTGSAIRLIMSDNARYTSAVGLNTTGFVTMRDNAYISGSGSVAVLGALVLQDDASITAGSASVSGQIVLCGKYKQTTAKTWTGKRVIDNDNAPEYDNNVKTQYDF